MKQKLVAVLVALSAHLLVFQSAQAFPDRPIKLVVASPAGSPPDVMARLLTDKMTGILGQPVIVDNRPGAGGTIGAKSVIAAEPDGYTLMLGSTSTLLIAPSIYKNAGYNAATFTPISRVADSSEVLVVHPSVAAKSVGELISLAKSKPGVLNFASAGNGTLPHIEGELLKAQAKIDISHVPYRGGGNALTGVLAGEVQIFSPPSPNCSRMSGKAACGDWPFRARPAASLRQIFLPWSRVGSISSSQRPSPRLLLRPTRRSRSGGNCPKPLRARLPQRKSSRHCREWVARRDRHRRRKLLLFWRSNNSAGLVS